MRIRIPYISLVAAAGLALGGCAYGDLGMGLGYGSPYYGSSYGAYGYGAPYGAYGYGGPYGGISYGIGYGNYYGGYGGYSPFGWYDNYYYPGTGYYVYDVNRRPYRMTSTQRTYWSRRSPALSTSGTRTNVRPNWSAFDRQQAREQRKLNREDRRNRRDD